jgi:nucleoprotein TPR
MPGLLEAELAERRAQLELEYEERTKAAETKSHKHTEAMKQSLNAKLKEIRQKLDKDHGTAIEKLRTEHGAEVDKLKIDHAKQLQQLNGGDGVAPTASEEAKPEKFEPTEQQIKDLVAHNPTVLDIVKRNVQAKLRVQQEQLRADFDKKTQDAHESVQKSIDNAVSLERKRQNVKFTMAERRAKEASVKVDFIERAANDTPQRPVGEVWSVISSKVKGVGNATDTPPSMAPAAEQLGNPAMALGDAMTVDEPVAAVGTTTLAPAAAPVAAVAKAPATPLSPTIGAPLANAAGSVITTGPTPPTATVTKTTAPPGTAPTAPASQAAGHPSGVQAAPKRRPSGVPLSASQAAIAGAKGAGQQKKRPSLPTKPAQPAASGSAIPRPGGPARGRGSGQTGGAGRGEAGVPTGPGAGTIAGAAGAVPGAGRGASSIPRGGGTVRGRGGQRQSGAKPSLNPNAKQWAPGSVQVAGAAKPGNPATGAGTGNGPIGAGGPASSAGAVGAGKAAGAAAAAGIKRAHEEGGQSGNAEKRAKNDG